MPARRLLASDGHMSRGERTILVVIGLAFVALWIVLAIGHIPDGG